MPVIKTPEGRLRTQNLLSSGDYGLGKFRLRVSLNFHYALRRENVPRMFPPVRFPRRRSHTDREALSISHAEVQTCDGGPSSTLLETPFGNP